MPVILMPRLTTRRYAAFIAMHYYFATLLLHAAYAALRLTLRHAAVTPFCHAYFSRR